MTSHYRNIISVVYLLFCLYITSASASSFIRQFTDGLNTNMQQESGTGPSQSIDEAHNHQEMASRDYELSVSSPVKGLRDRPPSSYSIKMESFNTLLNAADTERYESRPFSAAGYNWTLIVYPKGNKKDKGSGYISLYVAIDNSSFVSAHSEVFVDLRFYIFNKKERKFFTIQDTDVWRFNVFKQMWGFSQVISLSTFKNSYNGYLYDGNHCEFGVDVTIPTLFQTSELFTVAEKLSNGKYTWTIRGFSKLLKDKYLSDMFTVGGRNWNIQVNPSGRESGEGKALSLYLILNENEIFRPYERIFVKAKLRLLNQRRSYNNLEKPINSWFNGPGYGDAFGVGYHEFISLSDLKDSSKGFLVNDVLIVQTEIEAVSSTKYLPD